MGSSEGKMKKKNQMLFDQLMDKYDRKQEEDRLAVEREKSEAEKFWRVFNKLRMEVIKPVMKEIGLLLSERGHSYRISEDESLFDPEGQAQEEKITLSITPAGMESDYTSRISLTATARRKVRFYHDIICMATDSRESGTLAEFWVNEINPDIIEGKIIEVLQKVFEPKNK